MTINSKIIPEVDISYFFTPNWATELVLTYRYLRVVIRNVLLSVGSYFKENDMAAMRAPEVQFLGHVYNAILKVNTFDIETGYLPVSTFDGLVIDSRLNGTLLFGDGIAEAFMEFGDAIALLQWLSRFLRGENIFFLEAMQVEV